MLVAEFAGIASSAGWDEAPLRTSASAISKLIHVQVTVYNPKEYRDEETIWTEKMKRNDYEKKAEKIIAHRQMIMTPVGLQVYALQHAENSARDGGSTLQLAPARPMPSSSGTNSMAMISAWLNQFSGIWSLRGSWCIQCTSRVEHAQVPCDPIVVRFSLRRKLLPPIILFIRMLMA